MEDNLNEIVADSEDSGTTEDQRESKDDGALDDSSEGTPTEGASEDTSEGTQKQEEWLVPGRFKTKEDIINSYRNLESEYSRTKNQLYQIQQSAARTPVDPKSEIEEFARKAEKNPVEAIREIARKEAEQARAELRRSEFEREYSRRIDKDESFRELEPVMVNITERYSDLVQSLAQSQDPRVLDLLHLAAKGMTVAKAQAEAESKGKKAGEKSAAKRVKAQVEGSSGTKGRVTKPFEEMSLAEMEKELRRQGL